MKEIFYEILNLSLSAAYLVPVVLVLRLVLKKAPRWTMCLLWGLVALRLVMPFSLESDVSLHPGREPVTELQNQFAGETARPETPPVEMPPAELPEAPSVTPAPAPGEEIDLMEILGWVWLTGACAMALYGAVSYVRLKLKVRPSLQVEKRVFVCDGIGYPFLLGVLRPKVYLPSDLEEPHLSYVLAHEKAHVKRGDHLWKPLGFALLTIHWFNPLLWVAYLLLCRDIESACDEKVVRDMDNTQKDGYSRALLACSMQGAFHRRWISACPVAFGETGVRSRIKSVLHYKKPAFWVLLIAILACVAVGVFFLTDPAEEESGIPILQNSHIIPLDDYLPVELTTEDFPGVIFRVTKNHRLEIQSAGETKTLDVLREIFFFALADASGDGLADVCVSGYQDEAREKASG
ncbi:MAG: M56 family metallopeptidase, partial [Clostridia bacterium]|nr:M56 family metallopeptidase [Clostridia bacterium]